AQVGGQQLSDEKAPGRRGDQQFAAGLFVPLGHRSGGIGLMGVSNHDKRGGTAHEIRVAEVVADASAAAVASFFAFEEVRGQSERLEARMKFLQSMDYPVDALALTTDEASLAQTAARSLQQGFHLPEATVLFTDPSVAILEPVGTAGRATPHPVVNGPTSCPAIRSGRFFEVTSADDPVVCPYMPFRSHYSCVPLVAGGDTVGALFLEPDKQSILDVTVLRAAADRVALSLATRRVLETAQRQATTDGLPGRTDANLAISVSAGVAAWRPGRSAEQVLEAADAMLYAAKRAGKDRVLAETGLVEAGDGEGAA